MAGRDYKREYANYHSRPEQKKRRAQRNAARRKMKAAGRVRKGQDVHHKDHNTANNRMSNLVALPKSKNRSMNRRKSR